MNNKITSSRKQYRSFIKDHGIFSFKRKRVLEKKNRSLFLIILRILKEFKVQWLKLFVVMAIGLFVNITTAAFPWAGKYMIDTVLTQKSTTFLMIACAILMVIGSLDVVLNYFRDYIINMISGNFSITIKNRMMRHFQKLSLMKIQELKIGGIISRLQEDTDAMGGVLFESIVFPFNAMSLLVIALSSLLLINWKVSVLCMIFSLCIGIIAYFIYNIMLPLQKVLREDNSIISGFLAEAFNGITVVRSFCKEKAVNLEYAHSIGLLLRKTLYGKFIDIFVNRGTLFIFYLMQASIWLVGGYSVIKGNMTIGDVVVFISFIPFIFNPIFDMLALFSRLQTSLACAERTFELLDEKPEIIDAKNTKVLNEIKNEIKFHNVTFNYPDGTCALRNVSITIPKGKVTAFVGASGSGKTTLINLILRFYAVTKGKITVDSINIDELNLNHYRKMLSLVLQETFLFDATIKDNISFGNRKAQQVDIEMVAKIANCHNFIEDFENKYDTFIGEKGVKLSGGQRQRIALARALLTNPQILILDEATSNLDSESEDLIQNALKTIFKNRTTIVIAHRLSTILDADNIIVIEKGNVVEQGNHEELLRRNGRYAVMYNRQIQKKHVVENYLEF